jgi:hypothetical protein
LETKKKIESNHKQIITITTGGKGEWTIEIQGHLDNLPMDNDEITYGCVITVESTKLKNVYAELMERVTNNNINLKENTFRQLALTAQQTY